jgi:guanylate kinase
MNNPLFLFVGKSASGKTTIAENLAARHGYSQVYSYCTRKPRFDGEIGHVFIDDDEFDNLRELVAYTEYNGFRYGTTAEQLDQHTIYVVDVPGVETLLQNYNTDRPVVIIYFDSTVHTRINRMLDRGDSDVAVISRLLQDEKDDWHKQLDSLVWRYAKLENKIVDLYQIDANKNLIEVMGQVLYYMNKYKED